MILPKWAHATLVATTLLTPDADDVAPKTLITRNLPSISDIPTLRVPTQAGIVTGDAFETAVAPFPTDAGFVTGLGLPFESADGSFPSEPVHSAMVVYQKRSMSESEDPPSPSTTRLPVSVSAPFTQIIQPTITSLWTPSAAVTTNIASGGFTIPTLPFSNLPLSRMPALGALLDHSINGSDRNSTKADSALGNISNAVGHGIPQNQNEHSVSMLVAVTCNGTDPNNMTCSGQPTLPMREGGLENITNSTSISSDSSDSSTTNSTVSHDQKTIKSGSSSLTSRNPLSILVLGTLTVVTELFFIVFA